MSEKTKIKACPSCGGNGVVGHRTDDPLDIKSAGQQWIQCLDCRMCGPPFGFDCIIGNGSTLALTNAIAAWNAMPRLYWASVEQELPEEHVLVWLHLSGDTVGLGILCDGGKTWEVQPFKSAYYTLDARKPFAVTHWRPVQHPPLPQQQPPESPVTEADVLAAIDALPTILARWPDEFRVAAKEALANFSAAVEHMRHTLEQFGDRNA